MSDERTPAVGRGDHAPMPERVRVLRTIVTLTRLAAGAAVIGVVLILLNFEDATTTDYGISGTGSDADVQLSSTLAVYRSSPGTWAFSPAAYAMGQYLVFGGLLVLLVLVVLRLVIRTLNDNTDRLVEAARGGSD
ncbi:hypothetical protein [Streptomyces sp. NPDC060194]|uniref:hypothetical protein n=1 Tax=Streptomyces sp. NPDC060194 TaxID=3347069 RepID=UPI003656A85D